MLVNWYFEPRQPQRVTSWLKTMFNQSPIYSACKLSNHKLSKNHKVSPDTKPHKTGSHYFVHKIFLIFFYYTKAQMSRYGVFVHFRGSFKVGHSEMREEVNPWNPMMTAIDAVSAYLVWDSNKKYIYIYVCSCKVKFILTRPMPMCTHKYKSIMLFAFLNSSRSV